MTSPKPVTFTPREGTYSGPDPEPLEVVDGYLSEEALNARYGAKYTSPRFAIIGDSITSYAHNNSSSYGRTGAALAGDRLAAFRVEGEGGYTIQQGIDELLPRLEGFKPTHVLMALVTNDAEKPLATLASEYTSLESAVIDMGAEPIYWAPPPRVQGSGAEERTAEFASWARRRALEKGYDILDAFTVLADPMTGYLSDDLRLDNVHPNEKGHHLLGHALGALLRRKFPRTNPMFLASLTDPALTSSWGLFLTDGNGDGRADGVGGWSTYPDMALVPDDTIHGNWQEYSTTDTPFPSGGLRVDNLGIVGGHVYEMAVVMEADLTGYPESQEGGPGFWCTWRDGSSQISSLGTYGNGTDGFQSFGGNIFRPGSVAGERQYFHGLVKAPEGATTLRVDFTRMGGTPVGKAYARVAMFTARDLTDLGLA